MSQSRIRADTSQPLLQQGVAVGMHARLMKNDGYKFNVPKVEEEAGFLLQQVNLNG